MGFLMEIKNDMYINAIEYAIKKTLESIGNSEYENIVRETLKRNIKILESVKIHGLEMCCLTYEQFCKQIDSKKYHIYV